MFFRGGFSPISGAAALRCALTRRREGENDCPPPAWVLIAQGDGKGIERIEEAWPALLQLVQAGCGSSSYRMWLCSNFSFSPTPTRPLLPCPFPFVLCTWEKSRTFLAAHETITGARDQRSCEFGVVPEEVETAAMTFRQRPFCCKATRKISFRISPFYGRGRSATIILSNKKVMF